MKLLPATKGRWALLALATLCVLAEILWGIRAYDRARQPHYFGRPIMDYFPMWAPSPRTIDQKWEEKFSADEWEQAVGPEAVPWLFKVIARKDSFLARAYWQYAYRLPGWLGIRLPQPIPTGHGRDLAQRLINDMEDFESVARHFADALESDSVEVRHAALRALWWKSPLEPQLRPSVIANLKHPVDDLKMAAFEVLRDTAPHDLKEMADRGIRAIPDLIDALDEPWSRDYAARELARFGRAANSALPKLMALAMSNDHLGDLFGLDELPEGMLSTVPYEFEARVAALEAIEAIGPPSLKELSGVVALLDEPHLSLPAARVLIRSGTAGIDVVLGHSKLALQSSDRTLRLAGVLALRDSGPSVDVLPELIAALDDRICRTYAAQAVGNVGSAAKPAIPKLIELLDDRRVTAGMAATKAAAAEALGAIGIRDERVLAALARLAEFPDAEVQEAAAEALRRLRVEPEANQNDE